jgi:hypothetical protein
VLPESGAWRRSQRTSKITGNDNTKFQLPTSILRASFLAPFAERIFSEVGADRGANEFYRWRTRPPASTFLALIADALFHSQAHTLLKLAHSFATEPSRKRRPSKGITPQKLEAGCSSM